jgi:predicted NUDIX family NTP pyrophosphohydrolase
MAKVSAGLLMYRKSAGEVEVFLVHPGGPIWKSRDEAAWDIPKGEAEEGEDFLKAAKREFKEETSFDSHPEYLYLGEVKQSNGKVIHIWAFEGDVDPKELKSNSTFITWPPKSGKRLEIPEVDKGEFFSIDEAKKKIFSYQLPIIEEFERKSK